MEVVMDAYRHINNYWPYSLKDYIRMFYLGNNINKIKILDCYAGAGSFNSELQKCGGQVISISPLYKLHGFELEYFIKKQCDQNELVTKNVYNHFIQEINSIDLDIGHNKALRLFLSDYIHGLKQNRYQSEELPFLPYLDDEFDLALLHHFSFDLVAEQEEFIIASLLELARVAQEVRLYLIYNEMIKMYFVKRLKYILRQVGIELLVENTANNCMWIRLLRTRRHCKTFHVIYNE